MADAKERERLAILEWDKKTFAELKRECTSRSLDILGGKHDLIRRLIAAGANPSGGSTPSSPAASASTVPASTTKSVATPTKPRFNFSWLWLFGQVIPLRHHDLTNFLFIALDHHQLPRSVQLSPILLSHSQDHLAYPLHQRMWQHPSLVKKGDCYMISGKLTYHFFLPNLPWLQRWIKKKWKKSTVWNVETKIQTSLSLLLLLPMLRRLPRQPILVRLRRLPQLFPPRRHTPLPLQCPRVRDSTMLLHERQRQSDAPKKQNEGIYSCMLMFTHGLSMCVSLPGWWKLRSD